MKNLEEQIDEKEYDAWLASTFNYSPTIVITALEKRIIDLEKKMEKLWLQTENLNLTDKQS